VAVLSYADANGANEAPFERQTRMMPQIFSAVDKVQCKARQEPAGDARGPSVRPSTNKRWLRLWPDSVANPEG